MLPEGFPLGIGLEEEEDAFAFAPLCLCFVPEADGWVSAEVDEPEASPEGGAEVASNSLMRCSNFDASGVGNRLPKYGRQS